MRFRADTAKAPDSPLRRIDALAQSVEKPYKLYFGESDLPTPDFICHAAHEAALAGHTFYTPTAGSQELREAIVEKFRELHDVEYAPSEVICTVGAVMALFLAIQATIEPGDNVLVLAPAFPVFRSIVQLFGGEPREIPLERVEEGFRLDPERVEAAVDARTRMLIVNSPANPTGWIITEEEQRTLWDLVLRHDLLLISDEVYDRIVFDREVAPSFATVATDREHLVVLNSFSKTYNMTGWRLGYALCDEKLVDMMRKVETFMISSPPAMIQHAGTAALRHGEPYLRRLRGVYSRRREVVLRHLASMPGVSVPPSDGGFYVFPRIDGLSDSMEFAERLLREARVGMAPGSAFGPHGEGHMRICFASSEEVLAPALERLGDFLERNGPA